METQTHMSAGGVILDGQGRVVLTGRRSFDGKLYWGLPKGHIEGGEAKEDAALREAKEETGLEVEMIGPLPTINYWFVQPAGSRGSGTVPVRVHKFVHYYLMRAVGGDPTKHDQETTEVAFLDPPEAMEKVSFSNEREIIRAAVATG